MKLGSLLGLVLLLLAPVAARAEWYEASSAHFRVYAEGDADSARDLATRLEKFDKGMHVLNGLPDRPSGPASRLTVFVLPGVADIQSLARGRRSIRGFYLARAAEPVAFTPRHGSSSHAGADELEAEIILFHEYAHHFMMRNYPAAFPAWFVEGFAEFNSTARFRDDGGMDFGLPANHRAAEIRHNRGSGLESLFDASSGSDTRKLLPEGLYGRGWLLTHYLTLSPDRRAQLAAYLAAINRGTPGLEAARAAFGDLRKLDQELSSYADKARLPGVSIPAERLAIGPVSVRPLSAGESAMMAFRPAIERGPSLEEVRAMLPRLRAAAAPYPNDPVVQALLAEAENRAGNRDEADKAADRAIAAAPAYADGLIEKAWIAFDRARDTKDAAAWRLARQRIGAANRIDPDDPEPLILFYRSFLAQGIAPTANAVLGLNRAFELAPQDRGLRLMVARQHLIDGKAAEARAALAPVAFDPHGGPRGTQARAVLAKLDEAGPQAALAAWSALVAAREDED